MNIMDDCNEYIKANWNRTSPLIEDCAQTAYLAGYQKRAEYDADLLAACEEMMRAACDDMKAAIAKHEGE